MPDALLIPSPTGATRWFAHLGDPVAQVQAPMLMNRLFQSKGVDAVMIAVHTKPAQLAAVVDGLQRVENLAGILVTIPHKFAICAHAQKASTTVQLAGSANALRREPDGSWFAENFDGLGFVQGLRAQGHDPAGRRVALFGAGGAGVAIAAALAQAGITHLSLTDTRLPQANALAARLNAYRPGIATATAAPALHGADLVINATPIGMRAEDPLPFAIDDLPAHAVVADIIMKPAETTLLKAAAQRGLAVHAGLHMLAPQIGMYGEFFGVC
ncbi:shikimate dehydrogenase [Xylophilus sp. GW821-FHT01B05]